MSESQKPEAPKEDYAPKPLSFRQNVTLTVKILGGAALLVGLLWLGTEFVAP